MKLVTCTETERELLDAVLAWARALEECEKAHARGDEARRVEQATLAHSTLHPRIVTLAAREVSTVRCAWAFHPTLKVSHGLAAFVPQWMIDQYEQNKAHPDREPGCPGCDLFGICVWHLTPPENRARRGHARAMGEPPPKTPKRRRAKVAEIG